MPDDQRRIASFLKSIATGNRPYIGLLIVLNLLFFGDALFTADTYFFRDISNFHHPLKTLVTQAYNRGEWPLWNPYAQFGQPLLGNPNSMALCPTQLLFHLLPFDFAFDLNLVCHCLIGGIGAFYMARSLALSPVAALVTAIAYNFSGVVLSFVNLPNLAPMTGLFPWLAFLLKKTIDRPSRFAVAGFSLAVALFLLSIEPVTGAAILLFLLPFGVYSFITRPAGVSARAIGLALLIVPVSGVCLAAAQVLPTLELLINSARQAGLTFAQATYWSVHPVSLTQMLFPGLWADSFALSTLSAAFWSDVFFESREAYILSSYCGLGCLLLALLGLFFSESRALKRVLAGIALAAIILALGKYTPVYSYLFHYVPPFRFGRYPAKYLLALALSLALLAGLGIDQLPRLRSCIRDSKSKRVFASYLLLIAALLGASGALASTWLWQKAGISVGEKLIHLTSGGTPFAISEPLLRHSILYLWLVVPATCGIILSAWKLRIRAGWILALAGMLVFFDLLTNHSVNPIVNSDLYERSPVAEWLLDHGSKEGLFRVYHWASDQPRYQVLGTSDSLTWYYVFRRLTVMPYTAAGDHIPYSSFFTVDRLDTFASQRINLELSQRKTLDAQLDYLAPLNVRYVLSMESLETSRLELQVSFGVNSDQPLRIYRLRGALPRAYLVDSEDDVQVTKYTPTQVGLAFTASKPSLLVLLDSYYPGWRVWVDGQEHEVKMVNSGFRGVAVRPGQHQVIFRYDPKSFRYGLALTLSTLAAWIAALVFLHLRRDRRSRRQPVSVSKPESASV